MPLLFTRTLTPPFASASAAFLHPCNPSRINITSNTSAPLRRASRSISRNLACLCVFLHHFHCEVPDRA